MAFITHVSSLLPGTTCLMKTEESHCPPRARTSSSVAARHTLKIPSPPAETKVLPSGEKAIDQTLRLRKVASSWPVATSHNRTVESCPAVASLLPSGEKAGA